MSNNNLNNNTEVNDSSAYEEFDIKDFFIKCFHQRIWFIICAFCMLCLGVLYVKTKPNIYSRSAMIIVEDERRGGSTSEAAVFQEIFSMGGGSVYNEIGLLGSSRYMLEVVNRLDLVVDYRIGEKLRTTSLYKISPIKATFSDLAEEQNVLMKVDILEDGKILISDLTFYFTGKGKEKVVYDKMTVGFGEPITTAFGTFELNPTLFMNPEYVGRTIYVRRTSPKEVVINYKAVVNIAMVDKLASLVTISIQDESVARAEDVINTLITVYRDDAINDKNVILSNTSQFIDERLAIIESDLTAVDAEIEAFKSKNNFTDVASESNMYLQSVTRIDQESLVVSNQLSMARYMKSYLEDDSNVEALLPVNVGIADGGLQQQISAYNDNMNRRDKLLLNSSASNPLVVDLQRTLIDQRSSILLSINNLIASLEIQEANYLKKEAESLNKIKDLPSQQKYIISIQRQQTIKEQLYLYLLNKKEESELQLSITESNCRVVDYAEGHVRPVAPNKKMIVLFCFFLGLMIPAAFIYLKDLFSTTIKTSKDVKGAVSVPFLGDIPTAVDIPRNELMVSDGSRTAINEAFRIIRDNLDFMTVGDSSTGGQVLQLTSLNPNSGKTFVGINMAQGISLGASKAVIVDLDIRKGTLSKIAGVGVKPVGATQYLMGKVKSIDEIIRPYHADAQFDIVTSGPLPPNPAELLKGERLKMLIDELRARYDYVIIDNPPYGVVADAAICARLCDRSIYVIRAGKFDKRFMSDIQELYDRERLPNMSLLLNGVDFKNSVYGYGYGYGYDDMAKKSWIRKLLGI
ncbi:MAG: polysaccharide biosynthesis tyrosine autokinase [Rikenellaceae bacterium]